MSLPDLEDRRLALPLLLLLTALGGALRGWWASKGFIADEIGWIIEGGVWGNWHHAEAAVNPPGIRMAIAAVTTELWQVPYVGRGLSLVCGTAAIPVMFLLGRAVGGDRNGPGLIAAAMLAGLPLAVSQAAWFRSYGVLLLVLTWHLLALVRVVDAERPTRSHVLQLVASSALLPQIHYVMVAVLLVEGLLFAAWRRDPWFVRYYLPAAVLFAPLAWRIVAESSEHLAPQRGALQTARDLAGAGGDIPATLQMFTVLALGLWVLQGPRQRIQSAALAAAAIGLGAVAAYHEARMDLGIVPATCAIPLVAALPRAYRHHLGRALASVAVLGAVLTDAYFRLDWRASLPPVQEGPRRLARELASGSFPTDRPTWLDPSHSIQPAYFYMEGRPLLSSCPVDPTEVCFPHGGTTFFGFERRATAPGYILSFDVWTPHADQLGAHCRLVNDERGYELWDCPDGWTP